MSDPVYQYERQPVLTKNELAVYLRCSKRTIERRVSEGMPSFMFGGQRRFRLYEVMDWLEEKYGGDKRSR